MTARELERLVGSIARDLRLAPSQRYELGNAARRFAGMGDAEIRAEAHSIGTRSTNPLLGGAVGLLAVGICEERYAETLSPRDRASYEASMTVVGRSGGEDSGPLDEPEVAEAMARATALDAAGDRESAARIRAMVIAHQAERGRE